MKLFYIILLEIVINILGSGKKMVGEAKMMADIHDYTCYS